MKKLLLLLCLTSIGGCSILGDFKAPINVVASEQDAQIYINGIYQGTGIVQTSVARNENVSILVKKDGFYPTQREITTKISTLGILDALGGCVFLFPWIGLAFPGAWIPDQTNISILLDKK